MLLGIFVTISLFGLVISDQCSTSVSNFQIANFGNANLDVDSYIKISQSLSEMKQTTLRMEQKLHRMYSGDYLAISYTCLGACKECIYFTPDCEGFADGIYDNMYILHGYYFECRDERNIYGGANPCKTNMAPHNGEYQQLFGGLETGSYATVVKMETIEANGWKGVISTTLV
ncbi:unnamed protein product [Mytilus edulis]|uniref:Uncharacterized protein n=1 Tax=Mytilus edulis TaxID=6550 RepID=A0A8S3Q4S1_MYTED|nr:unnamed protein product [Mytilus edulis]